MPRGCKPSSRRAWEATAAAENERSQRPNLPFARGAGPSCLADCTLEIVDISIYNGAVAGG